MSRRVLLFCLSILLCGLAPARAWDSYGHYTMAKEAVLALPSEIPGFFLWGAKTVGHTAIDPDVMKSRDTPQLGHQEFPEHFLDFELTNGTPIPELRYDFVAQMIEIGRQPNQVGFILYAITEGTQRLSLAFAEYRCWPNNPHVEKKALVYAGLLAHYAEDMIQPLHTSVHYDGRADENDQSPRSGIHRQVDSLFEQPGFVPEETPFEIVAFEDLWESVKAEFMASHAFVDTVYELEPALGALYESETWTPELDAFAVERYHRTVEFLASLYLTAWRDSAEIDLSRWLGRRGADGELTACSSS